MRIAVSGTHAMGKSTLAEDFVENHPEFVLEAEPYHVLQEQFGSDFAEEPTPESFMIQLEYSLERTNAYESKDNVIFDRCPIDYLAYLMYVSKRDFGAIALDHWRDLMRKVAKSIERLEIIIFLPIVDQHKIILRSGEDESFRIEVDHYFKQIYRENLYGLFSGQQPEVVELWGNRQSRLARLEARLKSIK
jgi:deoxyadenosine/deoxycytidine kinase